LADSALDRETQHWRALQTNSLAQETRNQLRAWSSASWRTWMPAMWCGRSTSPLPGSVAALAAPVPTPQIWMSFGWLIRQGEVSAGSDFRARKRPRPVNQHTTQQANERLTPKVHKEVISTRSGRHFRVQRLAVC